MTGLFVGSRVLIVEDEMIVAFLLQEMLADLGCQVVGPAARVNQALALLDTGTVDAALLDVNLNGQLSLPVAAALAARAVPFIVLTGYPRDRLPNEYRNASLLQKPFDRSKLSHTLAELLTKGQSMPSAAGSVSL